MASLNCYHHQGRPAQATCNKCGKGLCSECADTLVTTDGGHYCVDCYKAILNENVAKVKKSRRIIIFEFSLIMFGFVLGLIIGISNSGSAGEGLIWGAVGGSLGTIIKDLWWAGTKMKIGLLALIVRFFLWIVISPFITLKRIIMRIKDIVTLSRIARSDAEGARLADQFFKLARNPEATVENEKGQALDPEALLAQLGQNIQVAHDGSINLDQIINRR